MHFLASSLVTCPEDHSLSAVSRCNSGIRQANSTDLLLLLLLTDPKGRKEKGRGSDFPGLADQHSPALMEGLPQRGWHLQVSTNTHGPCPRLLVLASAVGHQQ